VAKDVAVLRLSMPKNRLRDLQPAVLGSSGALVVGQAVWGLGNPHGLDHTLTQVRKGEGGEEKSGEMYACLCLRAHRLSPSRIPPSLAPHSLLLFARELHRSP
jgi:hypothetical protein